ncbi:MAG: hypothetical protein Q9169_001301 [Polycauliona sp. 2 TL-2023]
MTTGSLAAPGTPKSSLDRRWFTINPDADGPRPWPDHKLKYKFKDEESKKLGDVVKAGWKLWTDNGVKTENIDIIESQDEDALTIQVSNDKKAVTRVGYSGGATMVFGNNKAYGLKDKNANMAHELGHALGFHHEHQRDDRNDHVVFNCKNLADWSEDKEKQGFCTDLLLAKNSGWSSPEWMIISSDQNPPLCVKGDTYDEDSIMHYPGGAGGAKDDYGLHRKTVLGKRGNPNESFKKKKKPSSSDVDRANAMYTTPQNGKRDEVKLCGDEPQPQPEPEDVPEDDDDESDDEDDD